MFSKFQFLDAVKNPLYKIKAGIKDMISKQKVQITQIIPDKLYHISPPSEQNIESLLQVFKKAHQFQLWNIGQYSYNQLILTKLIEGRERNSDGKQIVYNLTYEYFANIPFCEMIKSIQSIEAFLSLSPNNKVYIHCQDYKRRSAVFLACYIFLTGLQTDIVQSILYVNKMLSISIQDKQISQNSENSGNIYKSQHMVLKNLMNYINNSSFINKSCWNLKKILINNAPKIHMVLRIQNCGNQQTKDIKFKVLLEIRCAEGIIYKKIFQDEFIQGESLCLRIPQTQQFILKDDFLIIIKYVYEKKGYSILRSQLNTNFIYDPYFRVQRNDMDLSVNNAQLQNQTVFMDLLLESNSNQQSQLSKLNILKENGQSQKVLQNENKEVRRRSEEVQKQNNKGKQADDEQEEGFGILDQKQQAEHNQKMQREIEEELARQLQNIRKKKTKEGKKGQQKSQQAADIQTELVNGKQYMGDLIESASNIKIQGSQLKQPQQKQSCSGGSLQDKNQTQGQIQESQSSTSAEQNKEGLGEKQFQSKQEDQKDEQKSEDHEQGAAGSSEAQSSSQESSSEEQAPQEEDLDEYLTKLQKQAEKHD